MSFAFAFLAGTLSILSPCVLPLIPIVFGTAASRQKYGPLVLAAGVVLSFVTIGLFVATIGYSIGLDQDVFKTTASVLMIAVGTVLALPRVHAYAAAAAGPVGNWADRQFGGLSERGGQFGIGLLLGAVWAPCIGPTLGAASLLAARGESLVEVALVMALFGIGAAVPLVFLGILSRHALNRWRGRMMAAGSAMKILLGAALVLTGTLILTGYYDVLSEALVESLPEWVNRASTRF